MVLEYIHSCLEITHIAIFTRGSVINMERIARGCDGIKNSNA